MIYETPLIPATLVQRYKRFLADVTLETGETITVHCPNPGAMLGLKEPGSRVWIEDSGNPKRKHRHTLELVEADGTLVGINTGRPHGLIEEAIRAGKIPALAAYDDLRREVKYGQNSRIDILLTGAGKQDTYVEIKNVHLRRQDGPAPGAAEFPDSVTSRGAKHLVELSDMVAAGHRAVMVYCVQRADCDRFTTAPDIDPAYDAALRKALKAGVEAEVWACDIQETGISVSHALPLDPSLHG